MSILYTDLDVTLPELRQLISHGLVLPKILDTLILQYKDFDETQLEQNMKKVYIQRNLNNPLLVQL